MDSVLSSPEKNNTSESGAVSFNIYEQLRAEIQHLKQELVSVSEQNVDLAIQLGQIDELNGIVDERNEQIDRLNQEAAALNDSIANLKKQLSDKTEYAQKADLRIEELLALEAELRGSLQKSQEECLDLKAQIERHQASIASLQELLSQAQASNARHVAALESLEVYISKPQENENKEETPPLLHLKNALQELLGTAGQVIFNRACRLIGLENDNLASATSEQLQKAAISIISPSLRLCRNENMVKELKERLRNIFSTSGEISPELELALNGNGKTTTIASSANSKTTQLPVQPDEQPKQEAASTSQDQLDKESTDEAAAEDTISNDSTTEPEAKADDNDSAQLETIEEEKISTSEPTTANDEKPQDEAKPQENTESETNQVDSAETQQAESTEVAVEKVEEDESEEEILNAESSNSNSVGDKLVRNTEVPNRTLTDKRANEFNAAFTSILDGTQTKFQDHVVELIYKMTWKPDQISERDRAYARPKQINKLSQSIIRSSVDLDLDQIVEWLNYLVMPKRISTYIPEAKLAQMSNIRTRQDAEVQDLLNVIEVLNKRIFRKDRLKIHFFDGPCMYLSYTKSKEPHLYFNNEIVKMFNQAQLTFFAARALFSLQRGYFELQTSLQAITEQPDYDPLVFGSTLLKRSLALALEKSIAIPADLADEIQNAWSIESNQELLNLIDRCYKTTKFAQFSYIKELLATSTPFQQSMNIEGDAFTLKFCNIYDASLAIVKLLNGCQLAEQYTKEGFYELFSDHSLPQTYLQQRLGNLWLSYYINGDEFAF